MVESENKTTSNSKTQSEEEETQSEEEETQSEEEETQSEEEIDKSFMKLMKVQRKIRTNDSVNTILTLSTNTIYVVGVSYSVRFIYEKRNELIMIFFGLILFGTSFIITTQMIELYWLIKEFLLKSDELEKKDKITEFVEKDYNLLKSIYSDEESMKNEYINEDDCFLNELKNLNYHLRITLPFEYNKELIMFFNNENKSFDYYSTNSDVHYKFLNSVCISYVLEHKCLNIYTDEKYIKELKLTEDEDEDEDEDKEYEKIKNASDSDEEDKNKDFSSLFYIKKTRKEKEKKKEIKNSMNINKFIYKGNLEEYSKLYLKDKSSTIDTFLDYAKYKESLKNKDDVNDDDKDEESDNSVEL